MRWLTKYENKNKRNFEKYGIIKKDIGRKKRRRYDAELKQNTWQDSTLKELKEKHDAILIATGVYKARNIEVPGTDLKNIFPAMQFLTA